VCSALNEPQLPVFAHVNDQSTPALLESLLTTAVIFAVELTNSVPGGAG
jgi:hypothetical protein